MAGHDLERSSRSVAPDRAHRVIDLDTEAGTARCYVVDPVTAAASPVGTLVLGHGAGKGTNTPDLWRLLALADEGWRVILVDQPWVLAGRKVATPPRTLDIGWRDVIAGLRERGEIVGRFVQGGRSAGARVACRTASQLHPDAVLALAFPLVPPGTLDVPEKWRTGEAQSVLDAGLPLLVVQGEHDTFGDPDAVRAQLPSAEVVPAKGPHGFTADPDDVLDAVRSWLIG